MQTKIKYFLPSMSGKLMAITENGKEISTGIIAHSFLHEAVSAQLDGKELPIERAENTNMYYVDWSKVKFQIQGQK
jgi:hypothetical protein